MLIYSADAQQDFSKVEIKTTQVSGNVYMLEGAGGNIGVSAGPDGLLIVDNQFAPLAEKISNALQQINPGRLKFVLNTHHHGDHTGGNAAFGAKEAVIVAQSNVRTRLGNAKSAAAALPVITFDASASVHFNGEEIQLLHVGTGHTDGDSIIFFTEANVVHMGDQYVSAGFPYVDFGSGGDLDGYIATQQAVLAKVKPDTKIIPGHGPLATVEMLREYNAMLVESVAHVRKGMAEGKTLEQLRADGLPEKWSSFGKGFITNARWIETIYNQAHKAVPPSGARL
ncbi:MAG TPA: MBL fold metallo-hydrolase [Opitutus sp.]|nr:MBL fold metallo-hydrolase [Opitutus sp.]